MKTLLSNIAFCVVIAAVWFVWLPCTSLVRDTYVSMAWNPHRADEAAFAVAEDSDVGRTSSFPRISRGIAEVISRIATPLLGTGPDYLKSIAYGIATILFGGLTVLLGVWLKLKTDGGFLALLSCLWLRVFGSAHAILGIIIGCRAAYLWAVAC